MTEHYQEYREDSLRRSLQAALEDKQIILRTQEETTAKLKEALWERDKAAVLYRHARLIAQESMDDWARAIHRGDTPCTKDMQEKWETSRALAKDRKEKIQKVRELQGLSDALSSRLRAVEDRLHGLAIDLDVCMQTSSGWTRRVL